MPATDLLCGVEAHAHGYIKAGETFKGNASLYFFLFQAEVKHVWGVHLSSPNEDQFQTKSHESSLQSAE